MHAKKGQYSNHLKILSCLFLYLLIQNTQSAETPSAITQHQVEITGFVFVPKQLKVKIGDTITWINKDIVPHNIIDSLNKKPISPHLATGEKFTFVVNKAMVYQCGLHPPMKGQLVLTNIY